MIYYQPKHKKKKSYNKNQKIKFFRQHLQTIQTPYGLYIDLGPAQGYDCKNKVFKHSYKLGKPSLQYFITGSQAMHHAGEPWL